MRLREVGDLNSILNFAVLLDVFDGVSLFWHGRSQRRPIPRIVSAPFVKGTYIFWSPPFFLEVGMRSIQLSAELVPEVCHVCVFGKDAV